MKKEIIANKIHNMCNKITQTKKFSHANFQKLERLKTQYRQCVFDEKLKINDFFGILSLCDSQEVPKMLVSLAPCMVKEELTKILRSEWKRCEAHKNYRKDFIELFYRTGFIKDDENVDLPEDNELTIYRGNLGENEPAGISWTLSKEKAAWFSYYLLSPRAAFLGIYKKDGIPTVWQAKVKKEHVLGYFTERNEQEVVVDPETLYETEICT